MPTLHIGDLSYGKDFRLGPESRADGNNGDHSFHTSCFLYGGTPFSAIVFGVLKGVVQLNDSEQILFLGSPGIRGLDSMFAEQEASLTNMIDTVGSRPTLGSKLDVQIGDLIRCTVVLQLEGRSCSQCKGHDVYDRIYRLKADVIRKIFQGFEDLPVLDLLSRALPPPEHRDVCKLEQPSRILSCGMIKIEALFRNAGLLECVILWRLRSWPDVREPTSHRFALSNGSTAPQFGGDWAPSTPPRPRERLDGIYITIEHPPETNLIRSHPSSNDVGDSANKQPATAPQPHHLFFAHCSTEIM
ncbi:hypothetical protein B0H13DRAFT_2437820 [Mycena leptocephala]|nr:hypothetical protein B0H13DRAFT_2437820 [Mycena leptocephala]